tara:strand:+ start:426 stop:746 length:321 start_codon:yes stop_codon:yes gene_type:complete
MINLECKDWSKNLDSDQKQIILDVRTLEEFEEKSIPGAILANILEPSEFMEVVEKLEKNSRIFVYCRSGIRSQKACNILDQLGFKETFNLNGGILEWEKFKKLLDD